MGNGITLVSLILTHYDNFKFLKIFLASLENHADKGSIDKIIVVNNGLSLIKGDRVELETRRKFFVRILDNSQISYTNSVNRGVVVVQGNVLIIVSNDIEWLFNSSIRPLLKRVEKGGVGIVDPQLVSCLYAGFGHVKETFFTNTNSRIYIIELFQAQPALIERYRGENLGEWWIC